MPLFNRFLMGLLLSTLSLGLHAALPPEIEQAIKRFIQKSPTVNGLRVETEWLEPNLTIPACLGGNVEILTPLGSRLWGRSIIQLRCTKAAWLINVPVNIHAYGDYVVASR
jgi:flagella basal body P-ring formation protein FlgA